MVTVLLASLFAALVSAKTHVSMQKSFYYDTWSMTTSFSVPDDSTLTVKYRSKNRSIYADKNDNSIVYYELGVYLDDEYDRAKKLKTCEEKRSLATKIIDIGSDLHGAWSDVL